MNLRPRFLVFTLLLFAAASIAGWFALLKITDDIVQQWAIRYAQRQVLYDKQRLLQPISREVSLATQLANSQAIKDWASQPNDGNRAQRAITELESFRANFQDKSYFFALAQTGEYFYNNAQNEFADRQKRYVLSEKKSKDDWFFEQIRQNRPIHLNVNIDRELGVTKLWINALVRGSSEPLAILGTGLDLTGVVRDVVESNVDGISSIYLDRSGAIQLHRDHGLIDFASIIKSSADQNTLRLIFTREQDRQNILAAMKQLASGHETVATRFVTVDGRRQLAGLIYLPEVDWYQVTLLDIGVLFPISQFASLLALFAAIMLVLLIAFNLALRAYVLNPLAELELSFRTFESGKPLPDSISKNATGELRHLMQHFITLASSVVKARDELEAKVLDRTQALERLTKIDHLTELLNRRGMSERLEAEFNRALREKTRFGILWIDVDNFKDINDQYGHALGDQVLKQIAHVITQTIRKYDVAARWGGDEFLVLVYTSDQSSLNHLGQRLVEAIANCKEVRYPNGHPVDMQVSIGGYLARSDDKISQILKAGDDALYAAKLAGRNVYRSTQY